ncbi:hypothetical protein PILCRDRAFT_813384 [Piloderma croceum F 1598]|uniref:Uncharacterized protein n=1 Tax=Piloderma croceum (strain F 1598) TaxID=765440 RepID=A0A0C3GFL8_PILCF|nr:hypothetical protein PILCRDRAFT_813384 [Piloderma croceum F 1598]
MITLMPEAAIPLIICEMSVMHCQLALSFGKTKKICRKKKKKSENAAPSPNAPPPRP